jgi:alpha-amylase/alpha-mannosidase (GH57 family)
LGGQNTDAYYILNGKRVTIYDFKSKKNNFFNEGKATLVLSDEYEVNTYDYKKPKYNVFAGYPLIGFNPDDGVKIGGVVNYTVNGFNRFPYTQRHVVKGIIILQRAAMSCPIRGFSHT